eukprot:GHVU01072991.1.p1 GENE.GHVU01072991.1~~GHVU01072991.1.p1  ORF type:complete len:137 (+),score=26.24 GHVU01072991.1:360-770(+)
MVGNDDATMKTRWRWNSATTVVGRPQRSDDSHAHGRPPTTIVIIVIIIAIVIIIIVIIIVIIIIVMAIAVSLPCMKYGRGTGRGTGSSFSSFVSFSKRRTPFVIPWKWFHRIHASILVLLLVQTDVHTHKDGIAVL